MPLGERKHWLARAAEDAAHRLLLERGYLPIARNVRSRDGEIDVVAFDGDDLVFVEVKARRGAGAIMAAAEAVNAAKRRKLRQLARGYLVSRGWPPHAACRFDTVAVAFAPTGQLEAIELVRDAF
jgi:putative endonuclease